MLKKSPVPKINHALEKKMFMLSTNCSWTLIKKFIILQKCSISEKGSPIPKQDSCIPCVCELYMCIVK
jgi:hypothetical protein